MDERYTRLFSLVENQYAVGSPVLIVAGALLKDNKTDRVLAQIKLRNISSKVVKAAKVLVFPVDITGNPLGDKTEYQYLDLHVGRDVDFGQKEPVYLPDKTARGFSITVIEVVFDDNTVWTASGAPWAALKPLQRLSDTIDNEELRKQYKIKFGEQCIYEFQNEGELWYCACGALNHIEEAECHRCGIVQKDISTANHDSMLAECNERLRIGQETTAEKRRVQEQQEKEKKAVAEAKKKKLKKTIAIVIPLIVLIIGAFLLISKVIIPNHKLNSRYKHAISLIEKGSYEEGQHILETLDGYKNSDKWILEAKKGIQYDEAIQLIEADKELEAYAKLYKLGNYKESRSLASELLGKIDDRYNSAKSLIEKGSFDEAISILEGIRAYKDSIDLLAEAKKGSQYDEAVQLMETGNYKDAYTILEELGKHDLINSNKYERALALISTKDYEEAVALLSSLGEYKNSVQLVDECYIQCCGEYLYEQIKNASIGDTITFGSYEQDNNLSNGTEVIDGNTYITMHLN